MEPILSLGGTDYKDGEQIEYYVVNDYRMKGKTITLQNIPPTMRKQQGILQFKKSFFNSGWVIKNGWDPTANTYKIELNQCNVLNTNPSSDTKQNILLLKVPILKEGNVTENILTAGTRKRRNRKRKTRYGMKKR